MIDNADEWTPCQVITYEEALGEPRYGVVFDDFGETQEYLESQGPIGDGNVRRCMYRVV